MTSCSQVNTSASQDNECMSAVRRKTAWARGVLKEGVQNEIPLTFNRCVRTERVH